MGQARPLEAGESPATSGQTGQIEVRQVYELEDFPVNEEESGWREKEAEHRAENPASPPVTTGLQQFMILRKADRATEAGVMPNEELLAAMGAYNEEMMRAGVLLTGEGLQPSSKGARVNYTKGKRTVIDGPFTEAKELIAGFTLIQVKSKEEAIAWVKRWPALDGDGEVEIEVRQVFAADEFGRSSRPSSGRQRSANAPRSRGSDKRMKYLCLIYYEEAKADALPESEYNAIASDAVAYGQQLGASGHYIASEALQSVQTATTIRMRNGKLSITDGPFAETKEQLGGFFLVEARDLNDAIRVAAKIPPLRLGCIEVRPIKECAPQ